MPVTMVQNEQPGPTVLSSDPKGTHYVEWAGKGDPSGGDIQPCPDAIVDSVAFSKAIRRGVLSTVNEDSPEAQAALDAQREDYDHRTTAAAQQALGTIDQQANNDITVLGCVGPSPRGVGRCGIDVPVKEMTRNDRPPLCPMHAELASQFVPEQTQEGGKVVTNWTRVTLGAREKAPTS